MSEEEILAYEEKRKKAIDDAKKAVPLSKVFDEQSKNLKGGFEQE